MAVRKAERYGGKPAWVASSREVWLPGLYATPQAAHYAMQFGAEALHALWWRDDLWEWADGERVPDSRPPITTGDLRAFAARGEEE